MKFVQRNNWTVGAELGVDKGILFEMLLRECPHLQLLGVDVFPVPHRLERCQQIAETYRDRAQLHRATTHDASALVADESLDFVFIDADHSYDAVSDDIFKWKPKVRPGGWLGGHDYNKKFPGVVAAVDRVFGRRPHSLGGSIWGVTV